MVESSHNKVLKQADTKTELEIDHTPSNLRKGKCTQCKNYMHM